MKLLALLLIFPSLALAFDAEKIKIPDGGRVVCVKKYDRPSAVKRCADGTTIYASNNAICPNLVEVYDIQYSSSKSADVEQFLNSGITQNADVLHKCIVIRP